MCVYVYVCVCVCVHVYMCVHVCMCACVQLSEEELSHLQKESWENPVFDNMDQLMDERYPHIHVSTSSTI